MTTPGVKKVIVAAPDVNKREGVEALAGLSPRQTKKLRSAKHMGAFVWCGRSIDSSINPLFAIPLPQVESSHSHYTSPTFSHCAICSFE